MKFLLKLTATYNSNKFVSQALLTCNDKEIYRKQMKFLLKLTATYNSNKFVSQALLTCNELVGSYSGSLLPNQSRVDQKMIEFQNHSPEMLWDR